MLEQCRGPSPRDPLMSVLRQTETREGSRNNTSVACICNCFIRNIDCCNNFRYLLSFWLMSTLKVPCLRTFDTPKHTTKSAAFCTWVRLKGDYFYAYFLELSKNAVLMQWTSIVGLLGDVDFIHFSETMNCKHCFKVPPNLANFCLPSLDFNGFVSLFSHTLIIHEHSRSLWKQHFHSFCQSLIKHPQLIHSAELRVMHCYMNITARWM